MELDYESLFSYRNLYLSYLKARRGKRWSDEVISYSLNLEANLHSLEKRRKRRDYPFDGYYSFSIHEPKERQIQAIHFQDRILQHCSNRGYALKFDIHHYFPSISHSCRKEKRKRIVTNYDILRYIFFLIDTYHEEEKEDTGLPIGNQLSQCCGLLYLDKVDRSIKEKYRMKYYSRYRDDGIVIGKDKRILKSCLSSIQEQLEKDKLLLNPKTCIVSLEHGFEYLGFCYSRKGNEKIIQVLKKKKKERILRFVKRRRKTDGKYDTLFYQDYLKRGNNYHFLLDIEKICKSK